MIEADDVTVRIGRRMVLDGVSFTAQTGTVTGIVGPNGGGKTTLLRSLVRATPLSRGRIAIDGHDIRSSSRRWIARRVAEVGQRHTPDESLTVTDEVSLGGLAESGVMRSRGHDLDARVAAAVTAVGLADRLNHRLSTLSGGELQRVALARALCQAADHVLLDEPTNHLDIRHRLETFELLRRIAPTVIVVLHDLEVAARACDQVVLLDRGRLVRAGSPEQVLRPDVLDAVFDVRTHVDSGIDGRSRYTFSLPHPTTADTHVAAAPAERNHA